MVLVFCSLTCAALAYDYNTSGVKYLPESVSTYLANSPWAGWEVTGWVNPAGLHGSKGVAFGFVAVKQGSRNDLVAFKQNDGWVYAWHNANALPQVDAPIYLGEASSSESGQAAFNSGYIVNDELEEHHCRWVLDQDNVWRLKSFTSFDPLLFIDVAADHLHYYNTGWVDGTETDERVYGTIQNDLRYFSLKAFPRTAAQAREKLSYAPDLPTGTLTAEKVKFTSGKKYKVYQGPGEEYGQAGNGKATVSTNDWIQVFGKENGWIMIQYDITSDHMRIGWISEKALPKHADVAELDFSPTGVTLTRDLALTDDPLFSQNAVLTLPRGQRVTRLATMGDWAYVESTNGDCLRGFIPLDDMVVGRLCDLSDYSEERASGTLMVDANNHLTLAMTVYMDVMPAYFLLTDEYGIQLGIASKAENMPGAYSMQGELPSSTSCIRFIPVPDDGTRGDELFNVAW